MTFARRKREACCLHLKRMKSFWSKNLHMQTKHLFHLFLTAQKGKVVAAGLQSQLAQRQTLGKPGREREPQAYKEEVWYRGVWVREKERERLINQAEVRLLNQGWLCLGETIKPVIICLCCTDLAIICPYLTARTERARSIYLHPIQLGSLKGKFVRWCKLKGQGGKKTKQYSLSGS